MTHGCLQEGKDIGTMTTRQLQDMIIKLKQEKDICILAHAYQSHDILEVADYVGDSFGLSQKACEAANKTVLMCGVRFMAETVKVLSPDKRVLLSSTEADCPMARQFVAADIKRLRAKHPGCAVVCYINTTADVKAECDVCVTSASAVKIVRNMEEKDILFIPDCNLGAWVAEQVPEKNIILVKGGCPVHSSIGAAEVEAARKLHPAAKLLVHPECRAEVAAKADYIGSTTGIMNYVKNNEVSEFIIGTENSIVSHLQYECPDKKVYPLSKNLICQDMKLTTLADVYRCVSGDDAEEITVPLEVRISAKKCIDKMLELG